MNYNILAPVYADQHRHLYMETEDSELDWSFRCGQYELIMVKK